MQDPKTKNGERYHFEDQTSRDLWSILQIQDEPMETVELTEFINDKLAERGEKITRSIVFYRLSHLRADRIIEGKRIGSGKGTWIWWANRVEFP